ncbi:MAG: lysine exporter LysO family protein [Candidatus Promineifilaceae bacterium]|nr:lysine exporter LysO family protein [Candidatus Promineifilaceae bacterium]
MKNSALLLLLFLAGVLAGSRGWLPADLPLVEDLAFYTLLLLLFFVGIGVGGDADTWRVVRQANVKIILVPAAVVVGTLAGAAAFSLLLPTVNVRESLAVGAGFGYYSLSSIVITELHGQQLGVVALLANVLRELMTLWLAPLFVRRLGRLAPIAAGGATAMDTTLPVISRFAGRDYAAVAVFSGVVLTILVPLLITLLLT